MDTLAQVKRNFAEVKEIRTQIKGLLDSLHDKIDKLKHLYVDFISRNHRNLDIFGLDSFHFQNKMLDIEYNHMLAYFNLVSNRMYGGYYKLYNLVTTYAKNNIDDKSVLDACQLGKKAFPRYKDLEPNKVYDFDIVLDIHHTIIQVITEMDNYLTSKNDELKSDRARSDNGLNIDNFIHAFVYKNTLLNSQIQLFMNYMSVFHKYHGKYLRRFRLKLMFMYKQIDSDVDLEQSALNKGFGAGPSKLRRRHSTDETILDDMKGMVATFGGGDDSPSSITPDELSEIAGVLRADRSAGVEATSAHVDDSGPSRNGGGGSAGGAVAAPTAITPAESIGVDVLDIPDGMDVLDVPSDDTAEALLNELRLAEQVAFSVVGDENTVIT